MLFHCVHGPLFRPVMLSWSRSGLGVLDKHIQTHNHLYWVSQKVLVGSTNADLNTMQKSMSPIWGGVQNPKPPFLRFPNYWNEHLYISQTNCTVRNWKKAMELPKSFLFQKLGIHFRKPTCDCFLLGRKNVSSKSHHKTPFTAATSPDLE